MTSVNLDSRQWRFAWMARYVLATHGKMIGDLSKEDHLLATSLIMTTHGHRDDFTSMAYVDDRVVIVGSIENMSLVVSRRWNKNPVLCIKPNGECYRSHGQMLYLENRLRAIMRNTLLEDLGARKSKEEGYGFHTIKYQWRRVPTSRAIPLLKDEGE